MAYASYEVTNLLEVIDAIDDFATTLGWSVSRSGTSDGTVNMNAPWLGLSPSIQLSVSCLVGTSVSTTWLFAAINNDFSAQKVSRTNFGQYTPPSSPVTFGGLPQVAHIFGEVGDTPWIAVFCDCGNGCFRNLAVGYLDKKGDYYGGAFVTGTQPPKTTNINASGGASNWPVWEDTGAGMTWLFRGIYGDGLSGQTTVRDNGSVLVDDGLYGIGVNANTNTRTNTRFVIGGPVTAAPVEVINAGANSYSGYAPIMPINLYFGNTSEDVGTSYFFRPIGSPTGIRSIDMTNFAPNEELVLADGSTWRIYPGLRKAAIDEPSNRESSGPAGFAVRVSEEASPSPSVSP